MEGYIEFDTEPLLSKIDNSDSDDFCNPGFDDSSSGYDSTDFSDAETDSSSITSMRTRYRAASGRSNTLLANEGYQQVRARVSCTSTLCESLAMISSMPEMCDVIFKVGPEEVPVYGVRAILGIRSKLMYQLIFNNLNNPESRRSKSGGPVIIPVRKYDPEVFRMLVQFIQSGTATINDVTATGLLCGAHQFELRDLQKACWKYIEARLTSGYEAEILAGTRAYKHHRQYQFIIAEIYAILNTRYHDNVSASSRESTV